MTIYRAARDRTARDKLLSVAPREAAGKNTSARWGSSPTLHDPVHEWLEVNDEVYIRLFVKVFSILS